MRSTSKMWLQWSDLSPMLKSGAMGCRGAGGTWGTGWWPRGEHNRQRNGWKVMLGTVQLPGIKLGLSSRCRGTIGSWRKVFISIDWEPYAAWPCSVCLYSFSSCFTEAAFCVFPLRHAGEIEVNRIITLLYSVYCKLVGSTNSLM